MVAIAGNDASGLGPIANWEEEIAVGAVDASLQPVSFSNIGPQVDLSAPAVDVVSIYPVGNSLTIRGLRLPLRVSPGWPRFISHRIPTSPLRRSRRC